MNSSDSERKKRTQRDYTLGFKLAVVSQIEKGDFTYKQAQKCYGIQGRSTVLVWLRKYGNLDWSKPIIHTMSKSEETPAQKIKRLEQELADEKLRVKILNTMIDIADEQLGTQIRKKYNTQQSSNSKNKITVSCSCRLLGLSRQSFYAALKRHSIRESELLQVKKLVLEVRIKLPRIGTRKLYYILNEQLKELNIKMGRDALFDYLRRENLLITPKKQYTRTTFSKHWLRKHPNLYKEIEINKPEQVFVSDITYVKTKQAVCYLSLVTDAYSRKIMGYSVSENMNAENVSIALKMAIKNRINNEKLIHHSDRGLQYCSEYYQTILKQNQIIPSMTDGYDCYQNALAERINGILKQEFLIEKTKDITELTKMVEQSVYLYNNTRPHLSLNMQTPEMRHKKSEEIKSLQI
ncbi:IS3 family transposase [Faecalibacter sp. LW9]|uniref:IS3 family transposase n=1 Tax=Faecalibacter sp. LW9 TaxID=3103144 RepID=UPI003A4C7C3B